MDTHSYLNKNWLILCTLFYDLISSTYLAKSTHHVVKIQIF